MFSFCKSWLCTGCCYGCVCNDCMTARFYFFLCYKHSITCRTVTSFCKSWLCTSCFYCFIRNNRMVKYIKCMFGTTDFCMASFYHTIYYFLIRTFCRTCGIFSIFNLNFFAWCMTFCFHNFLCYSCHSTYRTFLTFCKSCLRTGCFYGF